MRTQLSSYARRVVGIGLTSVLASVLLVEIALRVARVESPVFQRADPVAGVSYEPGSSGWTDFESRAYFEINRDGFRDRDHQTIKPADTVRVAVLGDSFTAGFDVAMSATFPAVLEEALAERVAPNHNVEVLNFGVEGYGTAQELATLRAKVWQYEPDIVVLAMTLGNDLRDNHPDLRSADHVPYFMLQEGELVLDDSFLHSPGYSWRSSLPARLLVRASQYSRLVQLANAIRVSRAESRSAEASRDESTPGEIGLDVEIYREPQSRVWKEAWRVTEAMVIQIAREVAEHGAELLVVTLSQGIQVDPDPSERSNLQHRLGAEDLFYPERRIAALGEREGISVLPLAPLMLASARTEGTHFHGFGHRAGTGHWNQVGHRTAGRAIADRLVRTVDLRSNRDRPTGG